jgi:hypothetical protein
MEVLLLPEHPNRDKNARTKIDFLIIDYWISYKQCKDNQLLSGIRQSESTFFRETQIATILQRLFALIVSVLTLLLSNKYSWQYDNQDHKNLHLQGMELYNMQCVAAIAVNNH